MSLQLDMHKLNKDFISKTKETRLYHCERPIIALTGGIATGKSTASNILKSLQIPIIDADELVKNIYKQQESHDFLNSINPTFIDSASQTINFRKLRIFFFEDSEIKNTIEAFIYKQLPIEFNKAYSRLEFNKYDFIIYDIPLLFEKNLQYFFDLNLLLYTSQKIQRDRLIKRDNISTELANKILHQQMDIEVKHKLADFVINNESNIETLTHNIDSFIKKITTF